MIVSWTLYNFLGCFAHLQGSRAAYPKLTAIEALLNVIIGVWAVTQILKG